METLLVDGDLIDEIMREWNPTTDAGREAFVRLRRAYDSAQEMHWPIATDEQIKQWAERNGFDGFNAGELRTAFEDAQTLLPMLKAPVYLFGEPEVTKLAEDAHRIVNEMDALRTRLYRLSNDLDEAKGDRSEWSEYIAIEFALRDAGFHPDRASEIAELATG